MALYQFQDKEECCYVEAPDLITAIKKWRLALRNDEDNLDEPQSIHLITEYDVIK